MSRKPRQAAVEVATTPAPDAMEPPTDGLQIKYRDMREVVPYARNSRTHPRKQLNQIKASLVEFGWTTPIAIADGVLVYGHGRLSAALELANAGKLIRGMTSLWLVPTVDLSHLSEAQRRAYVIADNKIAEGAGWDDGLLKIELADLQKMNFDLTLTGFALSEVTEILGSGMDQDDDPRGSLLELVNVTIAEPLHTVAKGDHFILGGRHHLLCVSVVEGWPAWAPLLTAGTLFCPYPGPFVPHGDKAVSHAIIMVQPDPYIAGHILDRYSEIHGDGSVTHQAGTQ